MNKVFYSIIVVFVVLCGLLLFQASQTGTSVVLMPSEVIAKSRFQKSIPRIRVAGRVTTENVSYVVEPSFELKFSVEDPKNPQGALPVVYQGIKPDMFAAGRDVIIDGEFRAGALQASKLLTQCPSKYEPPTPGGADTAKEAQ